MVHTLKERIKIIYIIVICVFVVGISYLTGKSLQCLLTPTCFKVTGTMLAPGGIKDISQFIHEKIDYKKNSLKNIAQQIKTQFPYIKHVSITQIPKILLIDLQILEPRFAINEGYVLLDLNRIESSEVFKKNIVSELPSVKIDTFTDNSEQLDPLCYESLNVIPEELRVNYSCYLRNNHEILFTHKKQPQFVILADLHSVNNLQKLNLCNKVKHEMELRKSFTPKMSTKWIVDIRFDNQVIVFSRGGKGHGYNTFT